MKIWRLAIIVLVLAAGSAVADPFYPVTVDFSSVTTTTDITLGGSPAGNNCITNGTTIAPNCITVSGVTFQYDPVGTDTASVDNTGIFAIGDLTMPGGAAVGALNLYFDAPAVGLTFTYDVEGSLCSGTDCLDAVFGPGGDSISYSDSSGTVSYGSRLDPTSPATPFNLVTLYFAADAATFDLGNIAYDSTVPEPASLLLFGTVLLGLGGAKLLRRRS